jgi:hypothetical protein
MLAMGSVLTSATQSMERAGGVGWPSRQLATKGRLAARASITQRVREDARRVCWRWGLAIIGQDLDTNYIVLM